MARQAPDKQSTFGALIAKYMTPCHVPGLSIAVARAGTLLHAGGYGFANLEHQVPATAETIYQTASVGKQFTAAVVLLLVERGVLKLHDPIAQFFDAAPVSWAAITVRHLLNHTSGISDDGFYALNLRLDYSEDELVRAFAGKPLIAQPGASWNYSNSGYTLLGILIRRVTGRFYGDLLRELVFTPLEMDTARVISEDEIVPNRAAGYRIANGVLLNQEYVSPSLNRTADGGLYMTVLDLAQWDRALHCGSLLSPASFEAMWTPAKLSDGTVCEYGFGWSVELNPHGKLVEHDGTWQGFSSHILRYVDEGLSVMVMANLDEGPATELAHAVADFARTRKSKW